MDKVEVHSEWSVGLLHRALDTLHTMAVLTRRTRNVNFRLSDEEFRALEKAYQAAGARSISDYIRSVVLRALGGGASTSAGPAAHDLRVLHSRFLSVRRQFDELSNIVANLLKRGAA